VLLGLAVWQAVEIWHHSELMSPVRMRVDLWADSFLRRLLTCPWCLSVWVGAILGGLWLYLPWWLQPFNLVTLGLAVSRLANISNDLTRGVSRTPKSNRVPETPDAGPTADPGPDPSPPGPHGPGGVF
jgi:hypothetical protein